MAASTTQKNIVGTAQALAGEGNQEAHDEAVVALAHDIGRIAVTISSYIGDETDLNGDLVESEYLVPFLTSKILGLICWTGNKAVEDSVKSAKGLAARGERLARRFKGGEVEDLQLQENNHRVSQRLHQLSAAEAFRDAAKNAYAEVTGRDYGIPQGDNKAALQSSAAMAASALAKNLGATNERPTSARNFDRRPMVYSDEDGNRYSLDAEGLYQPIP